MENIVIWSTDTDVVVLMVHVWMCIKLELWMMTDKPGVFSASFRMFSAHQPNYALLLQKVA